jgi:hypothetical protein
MSESIWTKPVVCIFKERGKGEWQSDPFAVVKAKQVTVAKTESKFSGKMEEFFTLMGDLDYISSNEGKSDHYVMCWFDDTQPSMDHDLRRLRGVRFNGEISCRLNEQTHKRTYNAVFNAEQAKLN